ncbi:Cdc25 family phosphatase-like protein Ibp1 [Geopyxis carbonaria]|nr:Cdc25 family phosphatase-like protein Ibp1 [Geopyxis carbonaria]
MASNITLPTLNRISRERLSSLLLTEPSEEKVTVVDVRDSDHIGGHIKASRHVPSEKLSYRAPELVRTLKKTEKVVFHCALSQVRGPSAALTYLRERERLLGSDSIVRGSGVKSEDENVERDAEGCVIQQQVYVLDGGFVEWQQKYGEDERLTESYNKELWANGY